MREWSDEHDFIDNSPPVRNMLRRNRNGRDGGDDDVGVDRGWPYRAAQPCQLHVNGYRYTPPTAPLVVYPSALKSSTLWYLSTWVP